MEASSTESRALADGTTIVRDRERNTLSATGGEAAALLTRARAVARLPPPEAAAAWPRDGAASVDAWRWALDGAYAEHLGDATRWLFDGTPRACIAGSGDRDAARPLEVRAAQLAADVAAQALPEATASARRHALLAQVRGFGLVSEPMLAAKRDALRAFEYPTLARWADAALALATYYASAERARYPAAELGPADPLEGYFSLDFPSATTPPSGIDDHRWWAFCEASFADTARNARADSGFLIVGVSGVSARMHYRLEDGRRRALFAATASRR